MKNLFLLILLSIFTITLTYSQQNPAQQKVDYKIYANLRPLINTLDGFVEITYHNNSNDKLDEIYIYLYPNEFKSRNSLLAKELLKKGNIDLYFSKQEELGGYNELKFSIEGEEIDWSYTNKDKTIVKINLDSKLMPNESTIIKIKYSLKLPKNIEDLGYSNTQYSLINWYPKPLIYDKNGWNKKANSTYSLLRSDYGNYNVTIKIPYDFNVASSGILLSKYESTINEIIIIPDRHNRPHPFHQVGKYSTINYIGKNIKDFTLLASDQFSIKKDTININDKSITVNLFYDESKINNFNIDRIFNTTERAVDFYFNNIFDLPINQFSIVLSDGVILDHNTPNILLIPIEISDFLICDYDEKLKESLSNLWLKTILSIDQYQFPWLQNGLSYYYYDQLYRETHQIEDTTINKLTPLNIVPYKFENSRYKKKVSNLTISKYSPKCEISDFTKLKPALAFNYLKNYLGKDEFNNMMHNFFEKWKLKSPSPDELKIHFEQYTKKDLSWFFEGLIGSSDPFSYSIKSVRTGKDNTIITIENLGSHKIPFQVGSIKGKSIKNVKFIEGFIGKEDVTINATDEDYVSIDPFHIFYHKDNLKTKVKTSKKIILPKSFSLFKLYQPSNEIFPLIAFNENDGFMVGLLLNSKGKEFSYNIAPVYGFRSRSINGYFNFSTKLKPNDRFRNIIVGINGRRFHRLRNTEKNFNLKYSRISLYTTSYFNSDCNKSKGYFNYSFSVIKDENYTRQGIKSLFRYINSAELVKTGGNSITPYKIKLGLEHQYYLNYSTRQYLKVSGEINASYMYKKNRSIYIRLYGTGYLFNTNTYSTGTQYGTLSLIGYGANDYSYNHFFINRAAQNGFYSRQLSMNSGGFKTALSSSYSIGQSNKFVASANFRFDLPIKMFIKPYFDIGIYGDLPTLSDGYKNKILYSSGLVFQIIKDKMEVYLPILNSNEIENIYKESGSFFNRISFLLDLRLPIKD